MTKRQVKKRKKYIAVSCSHGEMINRKAEKELFKFCQDYKPDMTIHPGGFLGTGAFRAGCNHTAEAGIAPDIETGLQFLKDFHSYGRSRHVTFCGNHEDRLYKLAHDRREVVAFASQNIINSIEVTCAILDSPLYQYTIAEMWQLLGDTFFGHGNMFNMQAARDHAEMLGRSVVFGHTHTIATGTARTASNATGHNIGWLGDVNMAGYAKTRRQTMSWRNGWAFGEYTDDHTTVNQHTCKGEKAYENKIKS